MLDYVSKVTGAFQRTGFSLIKEIGVVLVLLVILIIGLAIAHAWLKRSHKKTGPAMTWDDLKRMRRTGLISEAEYSRIRAGMVAQFTRKTEPEEETGPAAPLETAPPPQRPITPKRTKGTEPAPLKIEPVKNKPRAVNLDALLEKGLISREEYERLDKITRKKEEGN